MNSKIDYKVSSILAVVQLLTCQITNMFDFRKSSATIQEQFKRLFRDEKKFRKNGNVENANFDFMKLHNEKDESESKYTVEREQKKRKSLTFSVCM